MDEVKDLFNEFLWEQASAPLSKVNDWMKENNLKVVKENPGKEPHQNNPEVAENQSPQRQLQKCQQENVELKQSLENWQLSFQSRVENEVKLQVDQGKTRFEEEKRRLLIETHQAKESAERHLIRLELEKKRNATEMEKQRQQSKEQQKQLDEKAAQVFKLKLEKRQNARTLEGKSKILQLETRKLKLKLAIVTSHLKVARKQLELKKRGGSQFRNLNRKCPVKNRRRQALRWNLVSTSKLVRDGESTGMVSSNGRVPRKAFGWKSVKGSQALSKMKGDALRKTPNVSRGMDKFPERFYSVTHQCEKCLVYYLDQDCLTEHKRTGCFERTQEKFCFQPGSRRTSPS